MTAGKESPREVRYEYLVTYKSSPESRLRDMFAPRRGRVIKQTLVAARRAASWARGRGYSVRVQRRTVGEWEDVS